MALTASICLLFNPWKILSIFGNIINLFWARRIVAIYGIRIAGTRFRLPPGPPKSKEAFWPRTSLGQILDNLTCQLFFILKFKFHESPNHGCYCSAFIALAAHCKNFLWQSFDIVQHLMEKPANLTFISFVTVFIQRSQSAFHYINRDQTSA